MEEGRYEGHVIILPCPAQGHINPMLQFGKRLAHHGVRVTLATTRFILRSIPTTPEPGPITVASISDGFDDGFTETTTVSAYLDRFESTGTQTLTDLIESYQANGPRVSAIVYDALMPWAQDVGRRLGITCAVFFTQSCAVNAIYCHANEGRLTVPATAPVSLPGLPRLEPGDLPSYMTDPVPGPYPAYLATALNQCNNLGKADVVLFNSFYELERQELDWLKSSWPVKTIGPTVPSSYLDNRLPSDTHYGFNFYTPVTAPCMTWLDTKPPLSVIYVSFGSMVTFTSDQTEEMAHALINSGKNFLWVVRTTEAIKLPVDFQDTTSTTGQGLVVTWSPQLEVLAHGSVGCFVTHCGWNSTMEGLCLGVPMIGMPQWTDQQTNGKYVEDVWRVGVRAKVGENGIVGREEIKRCIREVMEGERREEMVSNATKWSEMAKAAVGKGGSSDNNIVEFVEKYC